MNINDILTITLTLFAVVDILGSIPLIIGIRQKTGQINSVKATLVSFFIMMGFLFIGENLLHLIGIMGLILTLALFFASLNLFNSYKENPTPQADTKRIIKTGIYAYCRNPMYLAFIAFHFNMFLIFENVAYFFSAIGFFIWINNYVIPIEESYLQEKFGDEYSRYLQAVKKWMFF